MELKLRKAGPIYVIDVVGEMDLYNAFKLKDLVRKMIDSNVASFILNLEQVSYMDSSGIGALLFVHGELRKRGMILRIANVKGAVKRVIELTKLSGYLPLCVDVNQGIVQIRSSGNR